MKRLLLIASVALALTSCLSDPIEFNNVPDISLGENGKGYRDKGYGEEGELMRTSVRLYGHCSATQATHIGDRGFFVAKNIEDVQHGAATEYVVSTADDSFQKGLTDLEIDQTYYFCAFVRDGGKVAMSNISSFHTKAEGFALVNGLTLNDSTLQAKVADNGGTEVRHVGFCWGLQDSPDIFGKRVFAELDKNGHFSMKLPALNPDETYYFRAFADNGVTGNRISYSDAISVTYDTLNTPNIDIDYPQYSFVGPQPDTIVMPVRHKYPIQVHISVDWIELLNADPNSTDTLVFSIWPNDEDEVREGTVTFTSENASLIRTYVYTIRQDNDENIEIPDPVFKDYCVWKFDRNGDGEISKSEALDATEIIVPEMSIHTLAGIEHFVNITELLCFDNQLDSLNVSWNTALEVLYCDGNNLSELDVSRNTALTSLNCSHNNLSELDVSRNTALTILGCYSDNLSELDISQNTALTALSCINNNLSQLDVSRNTALTILGCHSNNLSQLDVSNNTELTALYCEDNNLSQLDVSNNTELTALHCADNNLSQLDVSNNTELTELYCAGNNLSQLDVSRNTALTELWCDSNNLSQLDVSNNTELAELYCGVNNLSQLDVSMNTALTILSCGDNNLSQLDVSNNTELTALCCDFNNLSQLDVSRNTALTELRCNYNNLSQLDVSRNTALTILGCISNNLSQLDVSMNTALTLLWCDSNNLSQLDVSQNPQLSSLRCFNCPYLTEIWLKTGQTIQEFLYDTDIANIYYK